MDSADESDGEYATVYAKLSAALARIDQLEIRDQEKSNAIFFPLMTMIFTELLIVGKFITFIYFYNPIQLINKILLVFGYLLFFDKVSFFIWFTTYLYMWLIAL